MKSRWNSCSRSRTAAILIHAALAIELLLAVRPSPARQAQLTPFGLDSVRVTALDMAAALTARTHLYAASDQAGVFRRSLESTDSAWISLGLTGQRITELDIQVWGVGPAIFETPIAALDTRLSQQDSISIYKLVEGKWLPADTGIVEQSNLFVLASFPSSGHEPPGVAFAGGDDGCFYRSIVTVGRWHKLYDCPVIDGSSILTMALRNATFLPEVWIGGTTGLFFHPWIKMSSDLGNTWVTIEIDLNLGVENACRSLAFNSEDYNTVYAGMEGAVIKSSDGGRDWVFTGLTDDRVIFDAIVVDPFDGDRLFAGGRLLFENHWQLFESLDAGDTWQRIEPNWAKSLAGIVDLVADPNFSGLIYIATAGDGVWRYVSENEVQVVARASELPQSPTLHQNYPNPFSSSGSSNGSGNNTETTIRYEIPQTSSGTHHVELSIYNTQGQLVRTLVDAPKTPGSYTSTWDGRDARGERVPSGVYLYRLKAGPSTGGTLGKSKDSGIPSTGGALSLSKGGFSVTKRLVVVR